MARRREICLVLLCQKRHAHGRVAWRERIMGATSALPWDVLRTKDPREQLESEKRGVGGGPVERVGEPR